jgi:hypothetical protein
MIILLIMVMMMGTTHCGRAAAHRAPGHGAGALATLVPEKPVGIIPYPLSNDNHWGGHEYPRGHRNYGLSVPFFLYAGGGFDAFTGVDDNCVLLMLTLPTPNL